MEIESNFLTGDHEKDTRRVTYLIFITSVAILSLVVAFLYYIIRDPEIRQVLLILDTLYAILFMVDFFLRLRMVKDRKKYLVRLGWLDFISSFPGIPALRIIRSLLIIRHAREITAVTPREIEEEARNRLATSVLYIITVLGLLVISIGSILIVAVEADAPNATITNGYDAMWWSLVTISTVGYGDEFPVTGAGRIIGVFMILVGVALFSTITSFLASNFTDRGAQQQRLEQLELAHKNARHVEELLERIISLEEKIAMQVGVPENEMKDAEMAKGEREDDEATAV